jgi:hypothetical protein
MQPGQQLLIFGASVRAAAFSALRAGLVPWCVDLFADADLRGRCPAMRLPGKYPDSFLDFAGGLIAGPWMYSGGLENHPLLVHQMSSRPQCSPCCVESLQQRQQAKRSGCHVWRRQQRQERLVS